MNIVELQITATGQVHKFKITDLDFRILARLISWLKTTGYGEFVVKKEDSKVSTKQSVSNIESK